MTSYRHHQPTRQLIRHALALGILVLTASGHAAAQSRLAKPIIDTVNHHIVRVMNTGPTAWTGMNGWQLVLVATVQPPDGQPGELINPVMFARSLIWDDAEHIVLLDWKPVAIKRYDAAGKFLGQLGREGDGPGEYRNPAIAARGARLVAHEDGSKIVKMWQNDRPGDTWRAESFAGGLPVYLDTLDRFYNYTSLPNPKTGLLSQDAWLRWPTSRWVGGNAPADTIRVPMHVGVGVSGSWMLPSAGIHKPFLTNNSSIIDRGGRMVWGDTRTSTWIVTATGRDTLRIYQVADTAPQFRLSARDSIVRAIAGQLPTQMREGFVALAKGSDLPDRLPAWREITEDRLGNLWITRYGSDANVAHFDVLDSSGRWLGSVAVPPHFGRAFAIGHDHVADLIEGDDGRPALRIFRIDRRGR